MKKIKVLHCLETVASGGVERRHLSIVRKLCPEQYEHKVICSKATGPVKEELERLGCEVIAVGQSRSLFDFPRYMKAITVTREFRPDIIHGAVYEGVTMAVLAGRLCKVPVVVGEETSCPINRSFKSTLLYGFLACLTDKMIAVSPAVENYLIDRVKLRKNKVKLIMNGVEIRKKPSKKDVDQLRVHFGLSEDDYIIGTVGRLFDIKKRVSDIIYAMPGILNQVSNAKLLIVGDGPDIVELKGLSERLGVSGNVIFAGYQANTAPYYALMDVFVLASCSEAFGLVLAEAMLFSLPVIATRVGGVPYVVVDGVSGSLIDPCSVSQIENEVVNFSKDRERMKEMGDAGLLRAKEHFTESVYVTKVENLYSELLVSV